MDTNKTVQFYNFDEISEIFENEERLVFIDDGICETIGRYKDIPDIIVDLYLNHKVDELKMFDYNATTTEPILTTLGFYLNKCNTEVRKDIINRLVELQLGQAEIKEYKLIDEVDLEEYFEFAEGVEYERDD